MNSRPKISVITPSYNQGRYIRQTIESVLEQRYPNFEHIVIDGGSTDETCDILRSYPHLNWVSEPDNGQSDALNKGFAKASGEIIAWINSDDWYAPGAFDAAVAALEQYPIVTGGCAITNDVGEVTYQVPNLERNWFDLLKYWVQFAIPTQPAIFFRRDLLTGLERREGEIVDPLLYYTMDYDLWMRIAIKTPLIHRLPKLLAYYRMTETNKTGGSLNHAEPEMSAIFHRSEQLALGSTTTFSVIVPAAEAGDVLRAHLLTLLHQSERDFEIILADYAAERAGSRAIRNLALELNDLQREAGCDRYIRHIVAPARTFVGALQFGIDRAEGRYVVALEPEVIAGTDLLLEIGKLFSNNRVGAIVPVRCQQMTAAAIPPLATPSKTIDADLQQIFLAPPLAKVFAARRLTLLEIGELASDVTIQFALRSIIFLSLFRGWRVLTQPALPLALREGAPRPAPFEPGAVDKMAAKIIAEISELFATDPFAPIRAGSGYSLDFNTELVTQCRALLKQPGEPWRDPTSVVQPA